MMKKKTKPFATWRLCVLALTLCGACILPSGRAQSVGGDQVAAGVVVQADLQAALARIEKLSAEITAIKTGDIRLGGEGDTITGFIYSLIAAATVISSVFYPAVIRPIRRKYFTAETRRAQR